MVVALPAWNWECFAGLTHRCAQGGILLQAPQVPWKQEVVAGLGTATLPGPSQLFLGVSSALVPSSLFLITISISIGHQIPMGFPRLYLNSAQSSGSIRAGPSSVPGRPVLAFWWSHMPAFPFTYCSVAWSQQFVSHSSDLCTVSVAAQSRSSLPLCLSDHP